MVARAWIGLTVGLIGGRGRATAADSMPVPPAPAAPVLHDALVYKDGDRVQGHVVGREGNTIIFKSDRFGEVRVSASDAVVIAADKAPEVGKSSTPATAPAPAATKPAAPAVTETDVSKAAKTAATRAEEETISLWEHFSPAVLTARVRQFFGPLHGRLAVSTEVVSDSANRTNNSVEAHLTRKWTHDEVQINGRYDFSKTNGVPTTDLTKLSGLWRREFNPRVFSIYRPTLELNRANQKDGAPADYLLLQQEIGGGYNLINTPTRKLRAGVSQNLFDSWALVVPETHTSHGVQSAFEEAEWKLPWRMTVTQRGVWYPVRGKEDGWEDRVELIKKLTETLSTSVRHEIRRNNPDGSAQDYSKLKLLFGLDF
jgi:hypothetical protein